MPGGPILPNFTNILLEFLLLLKKKKKILCGECSPCPVAFRVEFGLCIMKTHQDHWRHWQGAAFLLLHKITVIYSFNKKKKKSGACAGTIAVVLWRKNKPEFLVVGLWPQGVRSGLLIEAGIIPQWRKHDWTSDSFKQLAIVLGEENSSNTKPD